MSNDFGFKDPGVALTVDRDDGIPYLCKVEIVENRPKQIERLTDNLVQVAAKADSPETQKKIQEVADTLKEAFSGGDEEEVSFNANECKEIAREYMKEHKDEIRQKAIPLAIMCMGPDPDKTMPFVMGLIVGKQLVGRNINVVRKEISEEEAKQCWLDMFDTAMREMADLREDVSKGSFKELLPSM